MDLREQQLERLDQAEFDVLIVGGGINGAVSAAALSAHGLTVALVDRGDFASTTSQESSNLVWGGFKYLENYELPLVWNLCSSRNRLMKAYPTRITEVGFLATLDKTAPFPALLAGLGAFGYWGIGRLATKPPRCLSPRMIKRAEPVVNTSTAKGGIEYADAYLRDNDSRFVWDFIRTALDAGATAANYVELESATRDGDTWTAILKDTTSAGGTIHTIRARAIVNAAGPFVDGLNSSWGLQTKHRIVYSKGIHLVVPRLTDSERILAFFDDTGRLFYVIPMADRSVIGTTDTRTTNAAEGVTDEDRSFLLEQINARLNLDQPLVEEDIISERCGVRPLVVTNDGDDKQDTDWTTLSRKHEIEVDRANGVVTLFGGKLTDCLNMGEEVLEAMTELGFDANETTEDWFGEPSTSDRKAFYARAKNIGLDRKPGVDHASTMAEVLWRRHGLVANHVVDLIAENADLGREVIAGSDLLEAELVVMSEREMITCTEDFLRRRTKLALTLGNDVIAADPGFDRLRTLLQVPELA